MTAFQKEQALLLLAQAYYALRDNTQALALYKQVLKEYPKSKSIPGIYDRIARLYLRLRDMDAFFVLHDKMLNIQIFNGYQHYFFSESLLRCLIRVGAARFPLYW